MRLWPAIWSIYTLTGARAAVTVWGLTPMGRATNTATAAGANYTGTSAAYDSTVLIPPAIPAPPPPTTFFLQLLSSSTSQGGLSIPQSGTFFGFSIEMSVINQVLGINSSFIQVPFLNLMANIKQRAGSVHIRLGGNTQETAVVVDSLPDGKSIMKDKGSVTNPTQTPAVLLTAEVIYMLSNISSLVGVKWYLGVPMNDTTNPRLKIAEIGEAILGDNLLGLQVGNEPDLYGRHQLGGRAVTYSPLDYFNEFGVMMNAINNDPNIPVKNNIIGPSVAVAEWTPEVVFDTGYLTAYGNILTSIAVEHYPDNNCFAQFGVGAPKFAQDVFVNYLDHNAGKNLIAPFLNTSAVALSMGKPLLMFETNTASCGGFPGISDSFGAAMWALDYGFTMAYNNFSGALLHVGGHNVYYNPFTAPPTNESSFHQWTVGPIFYAPLIIAEAFGPTGTAQIVDLNANAGNIYTPAYAIYERGTIARLALFNFVTDSSGASTYTASIAIGGTGVGQPNGSPASIRVKRLSASSVSDKDNITWAGQSFGNHFESDGRLRGDLSVETVNCANNVCQIQVPAPGFALVFLSDAAFEGTTQDPQTFATTAVTKTVNTVTIDQAALATSNGWRSSSQTYLGSTSKRSSATPMFVPCTMVSLVMLGAILLGTQVR